MTRKQVHRKTIVARPPPGLRPKLTRATLCDLGLIHIGLVDSLLGGDADLNVLWEWMASVLTWSRVAQACQTGEAEIEAVAQFAVEVAQRYEATGQVAFSEDERELIREGAMVMDLLAQTVDLDTAESVAQWSRLTIAKLRGAAPPAGH